VRQSVDQLAAEFVASQQQTARDLAELKAARQEISDKISSAPSAQATAARCPATTSARKPAPVALRSRQEAPVGRSDFGPAEKPPGSLGGSDAEAAGSV